MFLWKKDKNSLEIICHTPRFLAYPTRFSGIFTRSGYFRLLPGGVRLACA